MSRRSVSKVVHHYQQDVMAEPCRPCRPWSISGDVSKPLERVYLVLPFFFNSFRLEAETNVFAFLLL